MYVVDHCVLGVGRVFGVGWGGVERTVLARSLLGDSGRGGGKSLREVLKRCFSWEHRLVATGRHFRVVDAPRREFWTRESKIY